MATKSKNIYRIPFAAGTRVKVTRDHLTHTPQTRIDMIAVGSDPGKVVAAADGVVRFIVDSFSENRPGRSPCNNNYVWIEHENGEWTKYSHLAKGSVTGNAGLSVGDRVTAGSFLGTESDVGCASGVHLHHEVFVPEDPRDPIDEQGFGRGGSARNRIPRVFGVPDQTLVAGETYTASDVLPGATEYTRHAFPANDFQQTFDSFTDAGYWPKWIDGYSVGGRAFFNFVFTPAPRPWRGYFGQTAAKYQQRFGDAERDGYQPVFVESYLSNGNVHYIVIFQKNRPGRFLARHGLTSEQHEAELERAKKAGLNPVCVSVVSVQGQRRYTVLYRSETIGRWQVRSRVQERDYQALFDESRADGRSPVYLQAYVHDGQALLSTIFASEGGGAFRARHGLSSTDFQQAWEAATRAGFGTQVVTSFDGAGSSHRFAAVWREK